LSSSISEYSPKVRAEFDGISWKRMIKIQPISPFLTLETRLTSFNMKEAAGSGRIIYIPKLYHAEF